MKIKYALLTLSAITITGIHAIVNPELTGGKIRGGVPTPESMEITSNAVINRPISGAVRAPNMMPVSAPINRKPLKGNFAPGYKQSALTPKQEAQIKELEAKRADLQAKIKPLQAQVQDLYKEMQPLNKQIYAINAQLNKLRGRQFPRWFGHGPVMHPEISTALATQVEEPAGESEAINTAF